MSFSKKTYKWPKDIYEKLLKITNDQKNENQNHNDISHHTCQNVCYHKDKTYVGKDVEKRELLYTGGENVN